MSISDTDPTPLPELTSTEAAMNEAMKALTVAKARTQLALRRIAAGRHVDVDPADEFHAVLGQLDRLAAALRDAVRADQAGRR